MLGKEPSAFASPERCAAGPDPAEFPRLLRGHRDVRTTNWC